MTPWTEVQKDTLSGQWQSLDRNAPPTHSLMATCPHCGNGAVEATWPDQDLTAAGVADEVRGSEDGDLAIFPVVRCDLTPEQAKALGIEMCGRGGFISPPAGS